MKRMMRFAPTNDTVRRMMRFAIVGGLCTLLQIVLLHILDMLMLVAIANAIAFILSAQINFLLSYRFTWRDRDRKAGRALIGAWLQYNTLVALAAGINTLAFMSFRLFGPDPVAVVCATVVSTACTYLVNHHLIFRRSTLSGSAAVAHAVPARAE